MQRRKVLIIPYFREASGKTKCILVKDTLSGDWTFISGTCEPNEKADACVIRELAEETLHCVRIYKIPKRTKCITIKVANAMRRVQVRVYFVPLSKNSRMLQGFHDFAKLCTCEHDMPPCENCNVEFLTYKQILRKRLWDYIRDDIMKHQVFIDTVQHLRIV